MMQSAASYPLLQSRAATARPVGLLAYARGVTLAFWMLALQLAFWWISDWTSWHSDDGPNFLRYYYLGFGVCIAGHLTLGLNSWIRAPFAIVSSWSGRLITLFCLIALIASPLSLAPGTTAKYALATWGVYLLLYLFWEADYRLARQMVVLAGLVLFAWQFVLILRHGLVFGIGMGGILRNYTGQAALTAMICCMVSEKRKIRFSAIAGAIFFALAVNSRGTMLAIAVFLVVYFTLYKGSVRVVAYGLIGLVCFATLLLLWPQLASFVANHVMSLHDKNRGFGSGFTGRLDTFKNGIDAFWDMPILGCGFRAAGGSGHGASHSGMIRLFVETGFVGGLLMLGSIFIELARRTSLVLRLQKLPNWNLSELNVPESVRLNVVIVATLCTTLTLWVYEPLYISLGSTCSLLFWLMMAAPTYVSTNGVALRR